MGRWYYHRKATIEESCAVTIYKLNKWGMLIGCQSTMITWTSSMTGKKTTVSITVYITDDPHVRFVYSVTDRGGNKTDYDYEVSLLTTPCSFSGVRYWFCCRTCNRRMGVLYLAPGDAYFRCRHCNNLSYNSRNRSGVELFGHTWRQIDELRPQIKRWTWKGRPTRKVRKLHVLEGKVKILSGPIDARIEKLKARISK